MRDNQIKYNGSRRTEYIYNKYEKREIEFSNYNLKSMRSGGRVRQGALVKQTSRTFPCRPPWHDLLSCKGAHSCHSVVVTKWDTSRQPAHPHTRQHRSPKISPSLESTSRHAWNPAAALISQRDKRWPWRTEVDGEALEEGACRAGASAPAGTSGASPSALQLAPAASLAAGEASARLFPAA